MSKIANKPKPYFKYGGKNFVDKFIPFANVVWFKENTNTNDYFIYLNNSDSLIIDKDSAKIFEEEYCKYLDYIFSKV